MPFDGVEIPLDTLGKFDQAIELIESSAQWTKYAYRTPNGRYCIKEALNIAGVAEIFEPVVLRMAEAVMDRNFCCIESFNDHPQTAHADVIDVLRRTREDVVAGKIKLPSPGAVTPAVRWPAVRWNEYRGAPPRNGATAAVWRKLFCWS